MPLGNDGHLPSNDVSLLEGKLSQVYLLKCVCLSAYTYNIYIYILYIYILYIYIYYIYIIYIIYILYILYIYLYVCICSSSVFYSCFQVSSFSYQVEKPCGEAALKCSGNSDVKKPEPFLTRVSHR